VEKKARAMDQDFKRGERTIGDLHKTGDEETTVIRRKGGKGKGIYGRQWGTVGGCGGGANGRIDENREIRSYKERDRLK
jgi:hypothetical protein